MRNYEVLFIVKPTLTDDEVKTKLDFVKEVIEKNGGEIANVIEMGTRKLAYKIDKYERGVYFVIYFKAPPALITELVRNIRYNEEIIRFLTVKYETKKELDAWEKLSKGIKLATIKKESYTPRDRNDKKYPSSRQEYSRPVAKKTDTEETVVSEEVKAD